jgi:pimeloyl-ACP methyl ester carboxylesterase
MTTVRIEGARPPERTRRVDSGGVGIQVWEWGEPGAPPLLLVHGGFDFGRTFDVLAPLLADAGFRVVALDQRGHGDSDHAALYSWAADVRDVLAVIESTTSGPLPVVGHSKGGGLLSALLGWRPELATRFVNLDGMPSTQPHRDVAEHEWTKRVGTSVRGWLDRRRRVARAERRAGTIEELARRRARMNPRLADAWLRYLVTVGAREHADGWRWKLDPALHFGGIGPWRPEWALQGLVHLRVPLLAIIGLLPEEMGWGNTPESLEPYLPSGARLEAWEDVGHFVHIEQPRRTADRVLEFLT